MLDVLLSLALNTSPNLPPAGTYRYQTIGQDSTGTSALTISRAGTVQLIESTSGTVMGIAATATSTMTLNADLTPNTYVGAYNGAGQNVTTSTTFNGAGASETFGGTSTNAAQTFALGSGAHFAVIDGALVSGFAILPAQFAAWGSGQVTAVEAVYGRAETFSMTALSAGKPPRVPAGDQGIAVTASIPFTEWYDPKTLVLDEVDVPSQGVTILRMP